MKEQSKQTTEEPTPGSIQTYSAAKITKICNTFMQKTQTTNPLEENINKNIENQGKKIIKKL